MKHTNPITSAQRRENSFITELQSKFNVDEIKFIIELARQHYFNPSDTIVKCWCVEDVFAQAEDEINTEKALKCLEFLENLDDEHCIEYEGIDYFLEHLN